jgi:hypothetical protein
LSTSECPPVTDSDSPVKEFGRLAKIGYCIQVTGFRTQKVLVLIVERIQGHEHRGDLNESRFINTSKSALPHPTPCSWAPMAHTCNPIYSGGRDQEGCGSKPAQANSLQDPISKISNTKRAGGVAKV